MNLPHNLHYFSKTVNREVKEVYWFASINALALALTFIFEPIFLYQNGYGLVSILFYYVQVYVWYCVLVFPMAYLASRIGYKHAIFLSSIAYVFYWLLLYQIPGLPVLFFVAPLFYALQKSLFWPAYNADIAMASVKVQRGREIGVLLSEIELVSIAGPFIGGLISASFGFGTLFAISGVLILGANYALFKSPDIYTEHKFRFKNFMEIFRHRIRNFFGYWGYAEDLMLMNLWPLYIFIAVKDVVGLGSIATFASLTSAVLMLYVGELTDRLNKVKLIKISSIVYGLTWVFRFLAKGLAGILVFDIMTKVGKALVNVPMVSLTYDLAGSDSADHAVAYSVFYEFSLAVGKIFTAGLAILILAYTGNVYLVFAVVGALTMFYGFLRK